MAGQIFMRVDEVAVALGVSKPYAYKLIKRMTCRQLKQVLSYYYTIYWNYYRICSAIGGMPPVVKRGAFLEMMADKVA